MEVNHPGEKPLTESQQQVLARFRKKLQRIASNGLFSTQEIRTLVSEISRQPDISRQMMAELQALSSRFPDGRLPRIWE